jgi:hypothetical protein
VLRLWVGVFATFPQVLLKAGLLPVFLGVESVRNVQLGTTAPVG